MSTIASPAVDLGHLRRERVDRRLADDRAAADLGAGRGERTGGAGQLALGPTAVLLPERRELVGRGRHRRGQQIGAAHRAERGLDRRRGVGHRQQDVVDDVRVEPGVQRAHLLRVDGGQRLLDEEHHVVPLG
ncbi:hypothetical protein [Nocardioides sp. TF02-7]|uniref:hypothetical protein n=1 Tax=Nocardioides sp. TF02-7 TaxID=2917724 RepID=UPI001F051B68|nr:hypothetical protein [Nocardioides sp. TF02-7]UMG93490.1 hypothetical protein MF408_04530 [Nocardioides sp. TF02-7]